MASDLHISFTSFRLRNQLPSKPSIVTSGSSVGGQKKVKKQGGKGEQRVMEKEGGQNEIGRDEGEEVGEGERLQSGKDDGTGNVRDGEGRRERRRGTKGHGRGREEEGVKKRKHMIIPRDHLIFTLQKKKAASYFFPSEKPPFARPHRPPQGLLCSPARTYTAR